MLSLIGVLIFICFLVTMPGLAIGAGIGFWLFGIPGALVCGIIGFIFQATE